MQGRRNEREAKVTELVKDRVEAVCGKRCEASRGLPMAIDLKGSGRCPYCDAWLVPKHLYLAGPMNGYPDHNFPAFRKVADELRALGYVVTSPAELDEPGDGPDVRLHTWEWYMLRDMRHLANCGGIAVLEGWEDSRGATLEIFLGAMLGLPLFTASSLLNLHPFTFGASEKPLHEAMVWQPECLHDMAEAIAGPAIAEPESVLQEADRLVDGARQADYGHPFDNYSLLARLLAPVFGVEVTPEQAALAMVQVKVARELHRPKRDNRVDLAGYAKVLDMIHEERERRTAHNGHGS